MNLLLRWQNLSRKKRMPDRSSRRLQSKMLCVIQKDAGILLASLKPGEVLECLEQCPVSVQKEHPLAILVLMRSMFNWKNIPKMLELKEILLKSIEEHQELSGEERGNLL